jgi:tripartite-type tricarboxylate transporter receptor subunit TctC
MTRLCILIVVSFLSMCTPLPVAAQSSPAVLLVSPKSGLKSLAEFAAWAKDGNRSNRKPLSYSSSGQATQRFGEVLARKLGIKTVHVSYRPASQGILDLIAGDIDFSVVDADAAVGLIQVGLVTALAVAAKQRIPDFPDVPTFAEEGYPELAGVFPGGNPASQTTVTVIMSHRPLLSDRPLHST